MLTHTSVQATSAPVFSALHQRNRQVVANPPLNNLSCKAALPVELHIRQQSGAPGTRHGIAWLRLPRHRCKEVVSASIQEE